MTGEDALLSRAHALSEEYRRGVGENCVGARADGEQLRASLQVALSDEGMDSVSVIEELARAVEPGLSATAGPRWFGFVDGGVAAGGARR